MAVPQSSPKTFVDLVYDPEAAVVPSGVLNIVSGFSVTEDARHWFNGASKITLPTGNITVPGGTWNPEGVYLVTLDVEFQANGSGRRLVLIRKNGTSPYIGEVSVNAVTLSGALTIVQTTKAIRLRHGDFLEFGSKHDTNVPTSLHIAAKVTLSGPIAL